jgi:hypothetical protein
MSEYVVLFPADDEAAWLAGTDADHQATFDTDREFAERLRARGGAVTGGAGSEVLVTDGPYAETVEQLSGFYVVTCDDYDALVEAAQVLTRVHPVVEIRPVDES